MIYNDILYNTCIHIQDYANILSPIPSYIYINIKIAA